MDATVYIPLMLYFPLYAVADDWEDTYMFSYVDTRDKTAVIAKRMKYFTNSGKKSLLFGLLSQ